MEPLNCEGGLPWRDGELLLGFLKEVSHFFSPFLPVFFSFPLFDWMVTFSSNPLKCSLHFDLFDCEMFQAEHKGLSGEINLEEGMRTHFQLDVMDKVTTN